jgi:adenylyl cyclase-associated protein
MNAWSCSLEATTSRLEDVSSAWDNFVTNHGAGNGAGDAHRGSVATEESLTVPASPSSRPPTQAPAPAAATQVHESIVAFDTRIIEGKLKPFLSLTKTFAIPPVIEQVSI